MPGNASHRRRSIAAAVAATLSLPVLTFFTPHLLVAADIQQSEPTKRAEMAAPPPAAGANTGSATPAEIPSTVPSSPAPSPDNTAPLPPRIVLDNHDVSGVLGKQVLSAANENMGRIIDIIVDRTGAARAAVIDFGGFLGVGSRKIAVDWNALHFALKDGKSLVTLEMTKDQVKAAPEYQEGKPITVLGALGLPNGTLLTSAMPER